METFRAEEGQLIVERMIEAVQENAAYLSEIDGAIGDGGREGRWPKSRAT